MLFRFVSMLLFIGVFGISIPVSAQVAVTSSDREVRLVDALLYQQLFYPNVQQIQRKPASVPRKNPWLSGICSFVVPGLGQFYNEQPKKGLLHLTLTLSGYVAIALALEDNVTITGVPIFEKTSQESGYIRYESYRFDKDNDNIIGYLGFAVSTITRIWSTIDAPIVSNRINKQRQNLSVAPTITFLASGVKVVYQW